MEMMSSELLGWFTDAFVLRSGQIRIESNKAR
jgi:hypothetical protein